MQEKSSFENILLKLKRHNLPDGDRRTYVPYRCSRFARDFQFPHSPVMRRLYNGNQRYTK